MSARSGDIASERSGTKATITAIPKRTTQPAEEGQGPITVKREKYDAEAAVFWVELRSAGVGFAISHVYDLEEAGGPFEPLADQQAKLRSALAAKNIGALGELLDIAIGPNGNLFRIGTNRGIESRTTGHLYDGFQVDMRRKDLSALMRALLDALPEAL